MVRKSSAPREHTLQSLKLMKQVSRSDDVLNSGSILRRVKQPLHKIHETDARSRKRHIPGKLELGLSILQHVEGQLNRADSKAQFTLTLDTLLVASSAFIGREITASISEDINALFQYNLMVLFSMAMFITLLVSTVYALMSVIPRFTGEIKPNNNLFYFRSIAHQERKDFVERYLNQSNHEVQTMLALEIYDLSGIATQKFALIRISHIFLFFSLGFWSVVQTTLLLVE